MEGIGFKVTMGIFAIAIILGLFLMVDHNLFQEPPDNSPSHNQKLLDCYYTAVDCKENENLCGECYNSCKYLSDGKEVKKGALQDCLTGNPQNIIEEETSNDTPVNSTSSNSTTSTQSEEPTQN